MKKRPDIKALVHAHPPILTGYAIANNGMMEKAFLPEPITEVGPLLMVPYATPLTEKLSEQFDAVIDKSNGFLMENHGALFCSPLSVSDAVELMNMSECRIIKSGKNICSDRRGKADFCSSVAYRSFRINYKCVRRYYMFKSGSKS